MSGSDAGPTSRKPTRRGTTVPTPRALKLLEGRRPGRDSGGRPVPEVPAFKRVPPVKPDDLSPDAAMFWDEVCAELGRLEVLKPVDGPALRAAAECFARFRAAVRRRQADGLTVVTAHGEVTAPWVRVESLAARELRLWCGEFGLTPAAEMRLGTGGLSEDETNPFAGTG